MTQTKIKKLIKILAIALTGIGLIAMLVVGAMFLVNNEKVMGENQSVVLADTSGTCGDNLTWTLTDEGVLTISGTGMMDDYPWKSTSRKDKVRHINIESEDMYIDDEFSAFSNLKNLISITVNPNNTEYSSLDGVLYNKAKTTIFCYPAMKESSLFAIPNTVTYINYGAFDLCKNLIQLTIPGSITRLCDNFGCSALFYKSGIQYIVLEDGVEEIGDNCFVSCENLKQVTIPDSVTSIGDGAFDRCSGLTSIEIPNSVTSIGEMAFRGCSGLTSIIIPSSVTSIGEEVFRNCSNLTSITIENGLTSIEQAEFYGCSSLTSIEIPSSVTSISSNAFRDCSSLRTITVDPLNTTYNDGNGSNCIIETATNTLIVGCKSTVIPNTVTSIGNRAFRNCSGLTSITIPSSVTSIGYNAFENCSNLTSINIPSSVTSIGGLAFYGCSGLTSIEIPNGVTSIEHNSFDGCSLVSINIPSSVTNIGYNAFGCITLKTITVDAGNTVYNDGNGSNKIIETATGNIIAEASSYETSGVCGDNLTWLISGNLTLTISGTGDMTSHPWDKNIIRSVVIEEGVTSISEEAFLGCSSLGNVTLPSTLTTIGYYAFFGCDLLRSINIPNGVTDIGFGAFAYCGGLKSINIPNGVTSLDGILYECDGLKSINISSNVISIDGEDFYGCGSLTSITVDSNNQYYSSQDGVLYNKDKSKIIKYPQGKTGNVFIIPNSVTSIGYYAFAYCSGLTSITISNGVETIGDCAFYDCRNLTSINIPSSVTSIGWGAFPGCLNAKIVFESVTVPSIGSNAFGSDGTSMVKKILVPNIALEDYKTALPECESIIEGYNPADEFTITWENWDGTVLQRHQVTFAELPVYNAAPPIKESSIEYISYDWDGWDKPVELAMENAIYTAKFDTKIDSCEIAYNLNGGITLTDNREEYTILDEFTLNNPSKNGYDFTGWTGSNGDDPELVVTIPTGTTGNLTYTANWTAIEYTITTIVDSVESTQNYTVESEDITLVNPSKEGYDFAGWTGSNGDEPELVVTIPTGSYGDKEYTANWAEIYSITYTLNGGSATNPTEFSSLTEEFTLTNPTKDYYDFIGWTGSNGSVPEVTVIVPTNTAGDLVYMANWTPTVYTITYTLNGGIAINPANYTVESEDITLVNPSKAGYDFAGWTGSNGDEPQLEVIIPTGTTGNKEYIANWSEPIVYTITYTLNGGEAINPTTYTVESNAITLVNPTKAGYTFLGWTGSNGEEASLEVIIPTGTTGNKEYTANFEVITYTITTTVDGVNNTQNYTVEIESITLVNPTKPGYNFVGWTGSNGETPQLSVTIPTGSTGNKEYVANWSEAIVYTITYTLNGGNATNPVSYTVESNSITLVNPTKAGYNFVGWTGSNGEEPSLEVVISQGSTGNKVYTANFEVITYTITTTVDGINNTQNYTVESESITLVNPTKAGYNFVGWTGSNGEEPEVEVVIPQGSTGDKVYTANWSEPMIYTITYTLNGGAAINTTSYTVESESIALTNPTKLGYTFTGWTGSNGEEPSLEVVIPQGSTGNKEYVANWSLNQYKITLHIDNEVKVINYNILSKDQVIEKPSKKGFNFLGWTGEDLTEATMELVIPKGSTGDREYTATWEEAPTNTLAIALGVGVPGGAILIGGIILIILSKQKKIKLW